MAITNSSELALSRESITAVVVTYNAKDYVVGCLDAIEQSGIHNVLVWDNDSSDGTVEIVRGLAEHHDDIRFIQSSKNLGFASAVNKATLQVDTPLILLVNPDCLINQDSVSRLLACMTGDESVGAVAPLMVYPDGTAGISAGGRPTIIKELISASGVYQRLPLSFRHALRGLLKRISPGGSATQYLSSSEAGEPIDVFWASGFCLLVRTAVWRDVDGFDESFFLYFEDVALGQSLRSLGYRSVCERSVSVVHDESASSLLNGKSSLYRESMVIYFQKYGTRSQRIFLPLMKRLVR